VLDYDATETLETARRLAASLTPCLKILTVLRRSVLTVFLLPPQLASQDLVRTVRLATVIGAKVGEVQAGHGGFEALRAKYFPSLDSLILEELMQRLGGQLAG